MKSRVLSDKQRRRKNEIERERKRRKKGEINAREREKRARLIDGCPRMKRQGTIKKQQTESERAVTTNHLYKSRTSVHQMQ